MLSIERCRQLLADKDLTDAEIEAVRGDLYEMVSVAFDAWLQEHNSGSKYPVGLLPSKEQGGIV